MTRLPFFMWIESSEGDQMLPTYGGPYDSYTIPEMDDQIGHPWHERELRRQRYDHDQGYWVDGWESVEMRVIHEDELFHLQEIAESTKQNISGVGALVPTTAGFYFLDHETAGIHPKNLRRARQARRADSV